MGGEEEGLRGEKEEGGGLGGVPGDGVVFVVFEVLD